MKRSTLKALYLLFTVVAVIILVVVERQQMTVLLVCSTLAILAISFIFMHKLRCPHCGSWPRKGDIFAHYCRHCGESLDD